MTGNNREARASTASEQNSASRRCECAVDLSKMQLLRPSLFLTFISLALSSIEVSSMNASPGTSISSWENTACDSSSSSMGTIVSSSLASMEGGWGSLCGKGHLVGRGHEGSSLLVRWDPTTNWTKLCKARDSLSANTFKFCTFSRLANQPNPIS